MNDNLPDNRALDIIAYLLKDPDWGPGMLEDIAELVIRSGRSVENICLITGEEGENINDCSTHEHEHTWSRH